MIYLLVVLLICSKINYDGAFVFLFPLWHLFRHFPGDITMLFNTDLPFVLFGEKKMNLCCRAQTHIFKEEFVVFISYIDTQQQSILILSLTYIFPSLPTRVQFLSFFSPLGNENISAKCFLDRALDLSIFLKLHLVQYFCICIVLSSDHLDQMQGTADLFLLFL